MKKFTRNLLIAVLALTLAVTVIAFAACRHDQKYTVTFDSNGGSQVNALTDVAHGSLIIKPADPVKLNHTFEGWFKDGRLTNPWKFGSDKVTSDVTLYAKWSYNQTEGFTMLLNGSQYTIAGLGSVTDANIVIPETYNGLPVTVIADNAFKDVQSIQTVYIPSNIKTIGGSVFSGCGNLTNVTLPDGLTQIKSELFFYCRKLNDLDIPSSVTRIDDLAFSGCASLKNVKLPTSLDELGENVFSDCTGLESLSIENNSKYVSSVNGVPANCIMELKDNEKTLVIGCKNTVIPTSGSPVTVIGKGAFYGCSELTGIILPNGIKTIEEGAFNKCESLASIHIPASVTDIGERAFSNCYSLERVTFGEPSQGAQDTGIQTLGREAFSYCYVLSRIHLPGSLTSIGRGLLHESGGSVELTVSTDLASNALRNAIELLGPDEEDPYVTPLAVRCSDTGDGGVNIYGLA